MAQARGACGGGTVSPGINSTPSVGAALLACVIVIASCASNSKHSLQEMDNEEWATDKELVATDDTVAPEFSPEVDSAVDSLFDPGSCVPTCEGRECGDDDCGGSCGMCVDGTTCQIRCTGCPAIEYPDCGTCPAETACRTHVAFCAPFCGPVCIPMVPVPAGPFMMGHDADPDTTYASSSPEHEVDVPAFNIDEYEVTVKAYRGCVYDGSCSPIALNYGMLACWSTLTTFNWVWPDRREHPKIGRAHV